MLKDNQEEFGKLKANRKAHVAKANIKPITKKEPEKSESNDTKESSSTKVNPKDEKEGERVKEEEICLFC